jgi:methionine-rich copper-binding protein CopC
MLPMDFMQASLKFLIYHHVAAVLSQAFAHAALSHQAMNDLSRSFWASVRAYLQAASGKLF